MPSSTLAQVQQRALLAFAELDFDWVLTGGAALAGFHLGHRETRDLDLFWRAPRGLPDVARLRDGLREKGFEVRIVRRTPMFSELLLRDGAQQVLVDLVADEVHALEQPLVFYVGQTQIHVDTAHEILVNKLNILLSRSEARDLFDVRALLLAGGDLHRALRGAAEKDGGFSPTSLSWVLQTAQISVMTKLAGWDAETAALLSEFRDELVAALLRATRP